MSQRIELSRRRGSGQSRRPYLDRNNRRNGMSVIPDEKMGSKNGNRGRQRALSGRTSEDFR